MNDHLKPTNRLAVPLRWAAVCCMAGVAMAGCGGSDNSSAPPGGSGASGSGGGSKTRIVYWVTPEVKGVKGMEDRTAEYGDFEKLQAEEYMKAHPDVSIEVQSLSSEDLVKKVRTSIASGSPPDVLKDFLGRTAGYAHEDLVEDLAADLSAEEKKDYDPFFTELYTVKGKLHALPMYAWAGHIVANRAVWEAAGKADLLPKEDDGSWTFEQFLAAMRAVAQKGKVWPWWAQFSSEQGDYCNYGFFWGKGAFLYAPGDYSKVTLNRPEGVAALQLLVDMSREELIPPGSTTMAYAELENMIGKGQVAAWGDSLYSFQRVETAKKENKISVDVKLQVLQFPHEGNRKNPLPVGPTGLAVFKQKDPTRRKAAVDFARWLNEPRWQEIVCGNTRQFPTRKSVKNPLAGDKSYALVQKWMNENGKVDLGLTSPAYYKVRVSTVPHFQAAILGQKTASQALADLEKEANEILTREAGR